MANRVTQDALEAVLVPDPNAVVTQDALEAVLVPNPNARVTQNALEVLVVNGLSAVLITQDALEVLVPVDAVEPIVGEDGEAADIAGYTLTPAFAQDISERGEVLDSLDYDLTATFAMTISESTEATDTAEHGSAVPIVHTIEESAEGTDLNDDGQVQGDVGSVFGPTMVILTHIYDYFETGERYAFSGDTRIASHTHYGKVLRWGSSTREIPIPPIGPPRLGQMMLEFDDTDQYFRERFGPRTPKGKRVDLMIGPSDGRESLFQIPASGVIEHATFPPGKMVLQVNDVRYKWLQKPFPKLINARNFANLPEGTIEAFAPFIFGEHAGGGVFKLEHVDTVQHRYCVACHTVESVAVFKRAPNETEFSEALSGWSLVYQDIDIGGLTYNFSFVEFAADQEGAEIRADVSGWPFSGGWGTVPPAIGVSGNAVEQAVTILYYIDALHKGRLRPHAEALATFDLVSFATVRQQLEDRGWDVSAYAITTDITPEVALTQIFSTFLIHWFPTRQDKTKLVMTAEETPADTPIFGDFHSILRETDQPELARDTRNQINYRFARNYATDQWESDSYDNDADQAALLDSDGEPIIEPVEVDFHACREADVASEIAAEYLSWTDQDAHRFAFEVDLPTTITKTELAREFLVTHYGGLKPGGWNRERFIPYWMSDQYDGLVTEIEAVRRVTPQLPPQVLTIGVWKLNALVGPFFQNSRKRVFTVFADDRYSDKRMVVLATSSSTGDLQPVDDGTFPQLTNVIGSFESRRYLNKIYVATQENVTGRVGYSVFDMDSETWTTIDDEVLASNSDGDCGVSICIRVPSVRPLVMYQADRETVTGAPGQFAGGDYTRIGVKTLVDGTWNAEISLRDIASEYAQNPWFAAWGDPNYYGSLNFNVGRCIAEENDSVRFVFGRDEPADVANTQDLNTQILSGEDVLSGQFEFQWTSATGYSPRFAFGDPCTFEYSGTFYTAIPVGLLNSPKLCIWRSTSGAGAPDFTTDLTTAETQPDSFGTQSPPMTVRWFKNQLHVAMGTRVSGQDDWAVVKRLVPPFFTLGDPGARELQAGPTWPGASYARHGAEFVTIRGTDYLLKVTTGNLGVPSTAYKSIFEKINLNDLPTDNGYTLAEWIADNT